MLNQPHALIVEGKVDLANWRMRKEPYQNYGRRIGSLSASFGCAEELVADGA
jgi:hypothetical protein